MPVSTSHMVVLADDFGDASAVGAEPEALRATRRLFDGTPPEPPDGCQGGSGSRRLEPGRCSGFSWEWLNRGAGQLVLAGSRIYDGYPDVALGRTDSRTFDGRIQPVEYMPRVLNRPPGTS